MKAFVAILFFFTVTSQAGQEGFGGGTATNRIQCDVLKNSDGDILMGVGAPYFYWVGPGYLLVLPKMTFPKTEMRIRLQPVGNSVSVPGGAQVTMLSADGQYVVTAFYSSKTKRFESGTLAMPAADIHVACERAP